MAEFSPQITSLFERAGYKTFGKWSKRLITFQYKKHLYRPSKLFAFLPQLNLGWKDKPLLERFRLLKSGIRIKYLFQLPSATPWDLAFLRDKPQHKITLLDFRSRQKTVFWSSLGALEASILSERYFAENGVPVVSSVVDFDHLVSSQAILGTPLAFAETLKPIVISLKRYSQRVAVEASLEDRSATARSIASYIGLSYVLDLIDHIIRCLATQHLGYVPVARVHGDLSPFNVVSDASEFYLIDFERSFVASIWYDLVYIDVLKYDTSMLGLEMACDLVQTFFPQFSPSEAYVFALSTFILDNLVFMKEREFDETSSTHTMDVIRRAFIRLQAQRSVGPLQFR